MVGARRLAPCLLTGNETDPRMTRERGPRSPSTSVWTRSWTPGQNARGPSIWKTPRTGSPRERAVPSSKCSAAVERARLPATDSDQLTAISRAAISRAAISRAARPRQTGRPKGGLAKRLGREAGPPRGVARNGASESCQRRPASRAVHPVPPSTPVDETNRVGRFPSGQRGQTVNLMAQPSQVRILFSPPSHSFARRRGTAGVVQW